jgi:hypothetical protein
MFVKRISITGEVEHLNWYDRYIKLRSRAGIEFPGKFSFNACPFIGPTFFGNVPKNLDKREIFWTWAENQKSNEIYSQF